MGPWFSATSSCAHDDVIKWKYFPCYWPFVRGIHRSPVNFPHKGQWRGALVFFYLFLNKRLSKHWWGWWFETVSRPLWRHPNVYGIHLVWAWNEFVSHCLHPHIREFIFTHHRNTTLGFFCHAMHCNMVAWANWNIFQHVKSVFFIENCYILIQISLTFVPQSALRNMSLVAHTMAWRRIGDQSLPKPIMTQPPNYTWCDYAILKRWVSGWLGSTLCCNNNSTRIK